MSTSKRIILEAIGAYLNSENSREAKQILTEKVKPYLGEYSQSFTGFLINYRGLATYRPIQPIKIYLAAVCSISGNITQKVTAQNEARQRIPMLPELQQFIENSGYSFQLLRGTSYLCEVQISAKIIMDKSTKRGVGRPRIIKPAKGSIGAPKKQLSERIFRLKLTQFPQTVAVSGELIQRRFGGDFLAFFAAIETFISGLQKTVL